MHGLARPLKQDALFYDIYTEVSSIRLRYSYLSVVNFFPNGVDIYV